MLSFLFFIVAFVLVVVLIVISTVLGFIRSIFSFGRRATQPQNPQSQNFEQQQSNKSKIFEKNEGEYVDYEEVK